MKSSKPVSASRHLQLLAAAARFRNHQKTALSSISTNLGHTGSEVTLQLSQFSLSIMMAPDGKLTTAFPMAQPRNEHEFESRSLVYGEALNFVNEISDDDLMSELYDALTADTARILNEEPPEVE